jgi:hypothetical protein
MNEHIQNLTEAQAKILLELAMEDLHEAVYNPDRKDDAAWFGWLTKMIETFSKKNTSQHENNH